MQLLNLITLMAILMVSLGSEAKPSRNNNFSKTQGVKNGFQRQNAEEVTMNKFYGHVNSFNNIDGQTQSKNASNIKFMRNKFALEQMQKSGILKPEPTAGEISAANILKAKNTAVAAKNIANTAQAKAIIAIDVLAKADTVVKIDTINKTNADANALSAKTTMTQAKTNADAANVLAAAAVSDANEANTTAANIPSSSASKQSAIIAAQQAADASVKATEAAKIINDIYNKALADYNAALKTQTDANNKLLADTLLKTKAEADAKTATDVANKAIADSNAASINSVQAEVNEAIKNASIVKAEADKIVSQAALNLATEQKESADAVANAKAKTDVATATQVADTNADIAYANSISATKTADDVKKTAEAKLAIDIAAKITADAKANVDAASKAAADAAAAQVKADQMSLDIAAADAAAKAKAEADAKKIAEATEAAKVKAEADAKTAADAKVLADAELAKAIADKAKADADAKAKIDAANAITEKAKADAAIAQAAIDKAIAEEKAKADADAALKIAAEKQAILDAQAKADAQAKIDADAKALAEKQAKEASDAAAKDLADAAAAADKATQSTTTQQTTEQNSTETGVNIDTTLTVQKVAITSSVGQSRGTFYDFLQNLAGTESFAGSGRPANSLVANNKQNFSTTTGWSAPEKIDGYSVINSIGYAGKWQIGEAALMEIGMYTKDASGYDNRDWSGISSNGGLAWTRTATALMGVDINANSDIIEKAELGASQTFLNNRNISLLTAADNPLTGQSANHFASQFKSLFLAGRTNYNDYGVTSGGEIPTIAQYQAAADFQTAAIQAIMINNWTRYVTSFAYENVRISDYIGKTFTTTVDHTGYGLASGNQHKFVLTESGILAGCHILGCGSVSKFVSQATLQADGTYLVPLSGNGTDGNLNVSQYLAVQSGYETPVGQKYFWDGTVNTNAFTKDAYVVRFGEENTEYNNSTTDDNATVNYVDGKLVSSSYYTKADITPSYSVSIKEFDPSTITKSYNSVATSSLVSLSGTSGNDEIVYSAVNKNVAGGDGNDFIISDAVNSSSASGNSAAVIDFTKTGQIFTDPSTIVINSASLTSFDTIKDNLYFYYRTASSGYGTLQIDKYTNLNGNLATTPGSEFFLFYSTTTPSAVSNTDPLNYVFKIKYSYTSVASDDFIANLQNKFSFSSSSPSIDFIFDGGNGNDIIYGYKTASNSITGGSGNDYLIGGDKNDTISDGVGTDFLQGGLGADKFVLAKDGKTDYINDFSVADGDKLDLSSFTAAEISAATLTEITDSYSQVNPAYAHTNYMLAVGGENTNITLQEANSHLTISNLLP